VAVTIRQLAQWKQQQRPIVALTAWDFTLGQILDRAGVDVILVGDSLATHALGYPNTLAVTLDEMLHHAAAVRRGVERALVVCDLPFLSYQASPEQAIQAAGRALKEAGVQAVKLEGGTPAIVQTVARLVEIGIPVLGHLGLTPQSVHQLGHRQQGTTQAGAERLVQQADALAEAGAFALVLEHLPSALAGRIRDRLAIPTIGIGAGPSCDGQVLVTSDLLGLSQQLPPFARAYAQLRQQAEAAAQAFASDVRQQQFPGADGTERA